MIAAVLWAGASQAQAPASGCPAMKDAIGCACALATGGTVTGRTWARGPDKAAFDACVASRGGTPTAKPATIPRRP